MAENKVEFGISNLHVGTYTVDDQGDVTMGAPYHQHGAVGFTPEQDSENNVAYADDISYWSEYTEGPFEGDLTVMLFDDEFKTQFLGYVTTNKGGLGQVKNATKPNVYISLSRSRATKRNADVYSTTARSVRLEESTTQSRTARNLSTRPSRSHVSVTRRPGSLRRH